MKLDYRNLDWCNPAICSLVTEVQYKRPNSRHLEIPAIPHWSPLSRATTSRVKNRRDCLTCQRSETAPAARGGPGPWQQGPGETRAPASGPPPEGPPDFSGSPSRWCPFWCGSYWHQRRVWAPLRWETQAESLRNPWPRTEVQVWACLWHLPPRHCGPSPIHLGDWILAPLRVLSLLGALHHCQTALLFLSHKHNIHASTHTEINNYYASSWSPILTFILCTAIAKINILKSKDFSILFWSYVLLLSYLWKCFKGN